MNGVEIRDGEVMIDGVAGKDVVAALRGTGLSEQAVVALLGQFIAQGPVQTAQPSVAGAAGETVAGIAPGGTVQGGGIIPGDPRAAAGPQGFTFVSTINQSAPECAAGYVRTFVHPDFVDGLTVVQAGTTPEELGFNARFHGLEAEFDAVAVDLYKLSNCLAELRDEVYGMARELEVKITAIDAALQAKPKDKDSKDTKEKDSKETKEKEKEGKDKEKEKEKEGKDKEKERKDKDGDKVRVEKLTSLEKNDVVGTVLRPHLAQTGHAGQEVAAGGTQRTFIQPQDRPSVGEKALAEPESDPEPAPTAESEPEEGHGPDEGTP